MSGLYGRIFGFGGLTDSSDDFLLSLTEVHETEKTLINRKTPIENMQRFIPANLMISTATISDK
jgi:hypothetical protein